MKYLARKLWSLNCNLSLLWHSCDNNGTVRTMTWIFLNSFKVKCLHCDVFDRLVMIWIIKQIASCPTLAIVYKVDHSGDQGLLQKKHLTRISRVNRVNRVNLCPDLSKSTTHNVRTITLNSWNSLRAENHFIVIVRTLLGQQTLLSPVLASRWPKCQPRTAIKWTLSKHFHFSICLVMVMLCPSPIVHCPLSCYRLRSRIPSRFSLILFKWMHTIHKIQLKNTLTKSCLQIKYR